MGKSELIKVKVYSPIIDPNVSKNMTGSTIWKKCYKESEYRQFIDDSANMHCYTFKFKGITPVQFSGVKKIK